MLTNECDVLIAVGMRFDDRVTGRLDRYAKQSKVIHLDIDPSEIDKNVKADVPVWGDCKESLPLITALLEKKEHREWFSRFTTCMEKEVESVIQDELHPTVEIMTMGEVIYQLNQLTNGDAIIVTDVGQHQMVACRYAKFNSTKSNVTSGGLGTMGFALPAAIGAKYGALDRQVVAVIGDGGIQMTIQELGTIMQNNIDVKILILNNRFLGMVRQWQQLFHDKRYSFVDIASPDYVKLADAYGIPGASVSTRDALPGAIKTMLHHKGAYLLEVMVGKENNVFPMVPQGCSTSEIRLK
jgi:acetolactate synthase-1/2/3 large subunit